MRREELRGDEVIYERRGEAWRGDEVRCGEMRGDERRGGFFLRRGGGLNEMR